MEETSRVPGKLLAEGGFHIVAIDEDVSRILVSCPGHFDIGDLSVYPHAYAWRLGVDTEPPCVSMRVDASISANRIAGTAY